MWSSICSIRRTSSLFLLLLDVQLKVGVLIGNYVSYSESFNNQGSKQMKNYEQENWKGLKELITNNNLLFA